ncbi:MAG: DUF493 family protein [Cyclobacteriaceae bacterium]
MSWDQEAFREKLESQHTFPGKYNFKFIVPKDKKNEILSLLPESDVSFKESSNGKYISISALANPNSSQEVLEVYNKAHQVKGSIAL